LEKNRWDLSCPGSGLILMIFFAPSNLSFFFQLHAAGFTPRSFSGDKYR
jgi:hypothetical protein